MATKLVFRLVTAAVISCAFCICISSGARAADTPSTPRIKISAGTAAQAETAQQDSKTQETPDKKAEQGSKAGFSSTAPRNTITGSESQGTQGTPFHRESVRESSTPRSNGTTAANVEKNEDYQIDARIFISGEAAREKGKTGFSQLSNDEKELTAFLGYRDYRLIKESGKKITKGSKYSVPFGEKKSVTVTPLSESPDRVKIAIEWKIPGKENKHWKKLLYFKRNHRSLIGGPQIEGGGMYLLSLEIQ